MKKGRRNKRKTVPRYCTGATVPNEEIPKYRVFHTQMCLMRIRIQTAYFAMLFQVRKIGVKLIFNPEPVGTNPKLVLLDTGMVLVLLKSNVKNAFLNELVRNCNFFSPYL